MPSFDILSNRRSHDTPNSSQFNNFLATATALDSMAYKGGVIKKNHRSPRSSTSPRQNQCAADLYTNRDPTTSIPQSPQSPSDDSGYGSSSSSSSSSSTTAASSSTSELCQDFDINFFGDSQSPGIQIPYPDPRNPSYLAELDRVYESAKQRIVNMEKQAKIDAKLQIPLDSKQDGLPTHMIRKKDNTKCMARTRLWRKNFTLELQRDTEERCEQFKRLRSIVDEKYERLCQAHGTIRNECQMICQKLRPSDFINLPKVIREMCESLHLGPCLPELPPPPPHPMPQQQPLSSDLLVGYNPYCGVRADIMGETPVHSGPSLDFLLDIFGSNGCEDGVNPTSDEIEIDTF